MPLSRRHIEPRDTGAGDMGPDDIATLYNVSRETTERLTRYAALLERWNRRINLVSQSTVPDLWVRHFQDSAQLLPHLSPQPSTIVDMGSGAGFPGLVLAALSSHTVTLIEADNRKCAFLREAAREMGVSIEIRAQRLEKMTGIQADIVTSRALASVDELLQHAEPLLKPSGFCLFLKGNRLSAELTNANKSWHIESQTIPSATDSHGCLLRVDRFSRKAEQG